MNVLQAIEALQKIKDKSAPLVLCHINGIYEKVENIEQITVGNDQKMTYSEHPFNTNKYVLIS